MHTNEDPVAGGSRERTLVGYAPGPVLAPADGAGAAAEIAAADRCRMNCVPEVGPGAVVTDVDADAAVVEGTDRRNPLSRRRPINRGRDLSKKFFEEGELQQRRGWRDSALAHEAQPQDRDFRFDSFDRVPKRRGPLLAVALLGGVALAILSAWALGWQTPATPASGTTVWSALQQPGAGWKPVPAIRTVASGATLSSSPSSPLPAAASSTTAPQRPDAPGETLGEMRLIHDPRPARPSPVRIAPMGAQPLPSPRSERPSLAPRPSLVPAKRPVPAATRPSVTSPRRGAGRAQHPRSGVSTSLALPLSRAALTDDPRDERTGAVAATEPSPLDTVESSPTTPSAPAPAPPPPPQPDDSPPAVDTAQSLTVGPAGVDIDSAPSTAN